MTTELDYEEAPELDVPLVRNWLRPALRDWTRGCYPRRRGTFVVWGWFILFYGVWALFKAGIYAVGVVLILAAVLGLSVADVLTYHHRLKAAG